MFIFFGWGKVTTKELGETDKLRCSNCGNIRPWSNKKYTTWFTLFFIPVIPYKSVYVKECPVCRAAVKIDKATGLESGEIKASEPTIELTEVQKNYRKQKEEFRKSQEENKE